MNKISFKGAPLTLAGRQINAGGSAPDFRAVGADLKEVRLSDFSSVSDNSKAKIRIITSFPSIDTPVCDMQVKEFNKTAQGLAGDIVVIGVSKDLPFAQKRFCRDNELKNVIILSDYKFSSVGINYGLLIKELNLLARAVVIVDKSDIVRYIQIVKELTSAPDYKDVLRNLEKVEKNPVSKIKKGQPVKCAPCQAGAPALAKERLEQLIPGIKGWQLVEDKKITKEFKFKDFIEAKYFLDLISIIAEEQGHHPGLNIIYNKLKVSLTTHSSGGLTENDFLMAGIIDQLGDCQ